MKKIAFGMLKLGLLIYWKAVRMLKRTDANRAVRIGGPHLPKKFSFGKKDSYQVSFTAYKTTEKKITLVASLPKSILKKPNEGNYVAWQALKRKLT